MMAEHSTPSELETQLAALLDELSNVQTEMLEVLSAKRDLMADGDLAGIQELHPRESELCQRLQNCHDRRAGLLATAAAQGRPNDSLRQLAASLPAAKTGGLSRQVKQATAKMRLLQHQSLTNWVLAQRSMLHLAQLLEIIATGGRLQPTYGEDDSSMSSGALVDRDA